MLITKYVEISVDYVTKLVGWGLDRLLLFYLWVFCRSWLGSIVFWELIIFVGGMDYNKILRLYRQI